MSGPSTILFVLPNAVMGGAERLALEQLACLDRRRFLPSAYFLNSGEAVEETRRLGVEATVLPHRLRLRNPWQYTRALGHLASHLRLLRPDLVFAHMSYALLVAGPVARALGIPVVVYHHGPFGGRFDRVGSLLPARVLANSRYLAEEIARKSLLSRPVDVIYPAVGYFPDEKEVLRGAREIDVRYALAPQALTMGIVARFWRNKGIDVALRAVAPLLRERILDRFFVVGGPYRHFEPGYEDELKALVAREAISDKVIFTGYQSDVRPFLCRFQALAQASVSPEGFGLTILEAMGAGKPVVASRLGGSAEILRDGEDGLYHEAGEVRDLEEKLRRLALDPALRDRLGQQARREARARFSTEKMSEALGAVFADTLGINESAAAPNKWSARSRRSRG